MYRRQPSTRPSTPDTDYLYMLGTPPQSPLRRTTRGCFYTGSYFYLACAFYPWQYGFKLQTFPDSYASEAGLYTWIYRIEVFFFYKHFSEHYQGYYVCFLKQTIYGVLPDSDLVGG